MLLDTLIFKFVSYLAGTTTMQNPRLSSEGVIILGDNSEFKAEAGLMLSDILTVQNSASIFYSYARDSNVGELLKQTGAGITVFAPTNKAVMALARKPHQGPVPIDEGIIITEEEFDSQSRKNVERWVSAHIVPEKITSLSPSAHYEALLNGVDVNVTAKSDASADDKSDWAKVVLNDNILIVGKSEAANGVLYLLDGALYG